MFNITDHGLNRCDSFVGGDMFIGFSNVYNDLICVAEIKVSSLKNILSRPYTKVINLDQYFH